MEYRNRIRGIIAIALITVSICMLVPTFLTGDSEDGSTGLPEWYTSIFDKKMKLGLDLQGGLLLQYRVQVDRALTRKAEQIAGNVRADLKEKRDTEVETTVLEPSEEGEAPRIQVDFQSNGDIAKLDSDFMKEALDEYSFRETGDTQVVLSMKKEALAEFRKTAVEQAIETLERRINNSGVAESSITRRGEEELVIQWPGVKESDVRELKDRLSQVGQLRFQIVDRSAARAEFYKAVAAKKPDPAQWPEALTLLESEPNARIVADGTTAISTDLNVLKYMVQQVVDDSKKPEGEAAKKLVDDHIFGYEEIFVDPSDPQLKRKDALSAEQEKAITKRQNSGKFNLETDEVVKAYVLRYMFTSAGMSGENVEKASVGQDEMGRTVVNLRFARQDAKEFFDMTKKYTNEAMAIMIDEIVYSSPVINEPIPGGRVQISFGSSSGQQLQKEANALKDILMGGALQAPLERQYESEVGPSLGADSIESGKLSMIVGFLLVVIFMTIYYKVAGVVANTALMLNVLFVLAGLTAFGATLTLPGIAGIVLTVGMAVDANVLIFERIREELRLGKSVRAAIDAGYEKAFTAILDANVTTGIAAVVLYQFGSGPIRGFAVTLGIGIVCSMYTALVITRLIFDKFYGGGEASRMSI